LLFSIQKNVLNSKVIFKEKPRLKKIFQEKNRDISFIVRTPLQILHATLLMEGVMLKLRLLSLKGPEAFH